MIVKVLLPKRYSETPSLGIVKYLDKERRYYETSLYRAYFDKPFALRYIEVLRPKDFIHRLKS